MIHHVVAVMNYLKQEKSIKPRKNKISKENIKEVEEKRDP